MTVNRDLLAALAVGIVLIIVGIMLANMISS